MKVLEIKSKVDNIMTTKKIDLLKLMSELIKGSKNRSELKLCIKMFIPEKKKDI